MRRLPSVVRSPKCWTQNPAVFFQWGGTIKVLNYKDENREHSMRTIYVQFLATETEVKTLGQVTGIDLRAQSSEARSRLLDN